MGRTISYPNGIFDDTIRAGDTVRWELTDTEPDGSPVDHTGLTATLHVRDTADADTPLLELSSPSSGISPLGGDGSIVVTMSAAQTRSLGPGTYVWALKLTGASEETLFYGSLQVLPEVVHA